jgi:DNA-binding MarR family transcriptional regulator
VPKKDELPVDDFRALAEFRYQIRSFLHFSEKAARSCRLNPQQHQFLLALKGIPVGVQPTVRFVAERLHIRHNSAVGLSNRLSDAGLIRKIQDREDGRRVLLEITTHGEAVLRRLSLIHRAQLETLGRDLIRSLRKLLHDTEGLHEKARSRSGKNNLKRTR